MTQLYEMTEWQRISLPFGLEARACIEPGGLSAPYTGDQVGCDITVALPTEPRSWSLHRSLRFCERLSLLGEPLNEDWGEDCSPRGFRVGSMRVYSHDFRSSYERAARALVEELQRLVEALEKRERLLAELPDLSPARTSLASPVEEPISLSELRAEIERHCEQQ